jgi:hypothetical protein
MFTLPVTNGTAAASQATARAASPSSQAPPSLPAPAAARARQAAHRIRISVAHPVSSSDPSSIARSSASDTWTQALTGCPARCGSRSLATSRRIAS